MVTSPFYAVVHYLQNSSATIPSYIRDRGSLIDEKRALEMELASQQGMALTLEHTMRENEELRQMLGASPAERIVASVIAQPPYTPYDTLMLDRGSDVGIVQYAPVFHSNGAAIGYVRSVTAESALVTLFSSPHAQTTVYVFGPNIFARAEGQGGGVTRISIPQGIVVSEGDMVVLPSLDGGLLGTIDAVESTPTGPEQNAFVTLAAPIASIRLVSVGLNPTEPVAFPEAFKAVEEAAQRLFTVPVPEDVAGLSTSTPTTSDIEVEP
jgi:cell shape-determining protein MreC